MDNPREIVFPFDEPLYSVIVEFSESRYLVSLLYYQDHNPPSLWQHKTSFWFSNLTQAESFSKCAYANSTTVRKHEIAELTVSAIRNRWWDTGSWHLRVSILPSHQDAERYTLFDFQDVDRETRNSIKWEFEKLVVDNYRYWESKR